MINSKSTLAKLLAKENIQVQHGNYKTAYFDVENRILGLPLWTNEKDLYDLLVGHEVGHALFTPVEGWHDAEVEIPGCPRSYINVVEDIRIEKLIQRSYPGLVACFKRGYSILNDREFFGDKYDDASKSAHLNLIDRLNLKSKLRDLATVSFYDDEQELVQEAFAVETWEDVLEVCRKLYEFEKARKDEISDSQMSVQTSDDDNETDGDGVQQSSDQDLGENRDEFDTEESGNLDSDQGESSDEADEVEAGNGSDGNQKLESLTDAAQRSNEESLIEYNEKGLQPRITQGLTADQQKEMTFSYFDLKEARENQSRELNGYEEEYKAFLDENKKVVQVMAKEFEMRKSAWQSKRAQTARSGSLDVNRLYSYKYNDDIFKRVTNIPNAKNHGLFLLVDYSGSMYNVMSSVLKQVLVLSMFCKKVNIPFEVYGFTSSDGVQRNTTLLPGYVDTSTDKLFQVLSSSLQKAEYEEAFRYLFRQAQGLESRYCSPYSIFSNIDHMGSTPLISALLCCPRLIKQFRAKANIQKVNFITMTDGAADRLYVQPDTRANEFRTRGYAVQFEGEMVKADTTDQLVKNLIKSLDRFVDAKVGYFLTENRQSTRYVVQTMSEPGQYADWNDCVAAHREVVKNKFVSYDNVLGYDRYFILNANKKSMAVDTEEFEVRENAKKGEITRAFKKHTGSKKANRTLAVKFAEMVA